MTTAGENPFRVDRIEALPYRAVVGPYGSGKTTLLVEAQGRQSARDLLCVV